ncbi:CusA/CzcA family heavy metal efflux RND transporter [Parvibaculum sp.]|jgi:cobalt-zinc-cadmium resistance protein CzcA|uniref:CusA/CzcA family heavy metal efflux RND transporter n=2 Tax=Parvibaculum sp. TaxID=2024848 RepID=UPI000EBCE3F1|nr:CusA/CzcA family heavy metal efflux RND transporter [Parvibaculum sp.]MBO6667636.1 CusA/CzcA family heavy metal efflux RND transporter [Parvibaculum sp.]MBO6693241.1 CusA/CzcA family heavy metal efflux RND transporter [Parvibaculum sp.]MBO6715279.1 CusA/CzcA family heavy metal efflux RND transporter [Parvibaculum sp.]HAC57343.1 CusA/CzcA family heavy metal efflux RND transporter [Rhodobiaceae bacterium]
MIARIVSFCVQHRWLVLLTAAFVAALGVYNFMRLPIDAVPDITNVQVQINTSAPGYSPVEVEQRVTFPLETAMGGLPGLDYTRSLSRYGLSQITVVFEDGTDIYRARQLIGERIQAVSGDLPSDVETSMGPIATGLGEIYMYHLQADPNARKADGSSYTLSDLRALHDWVVRPQLRTVAGVVEVNAIGGYERQLHIVPDPYRLTAYNLTFSDVITALETNNVNVGAGYVERNGEQYLIRLPGQVEEASEFSEVLLGTHNGRPIYVHDVADVTFGKELRTGAATHNGKETVLGTAVMLMGENSRDVAVAVGEKLRQIERSLPEGIGIETLYNRTSLVQKTVATVRTNLVEGAILVIVVLFILLRNIRAALITAAVIPLSMLITVTGMVEYKISANLMSLGAIDFGLIVDGAVIIVENCLRRLSEERKRFGHALSTKDRFGVVVEATREVMTPAMFGSFIITVVYLPILTLTGVEGKMFTPMAVTVVFALLAAMVLALTFVPAAIAIFVRGDVEEKESPVMRWAQRGYEPVLTFALGRQKTVAVAAGILVVIAAAGATRFGTEFIPRLDEGDVAVQALRVPGTSLSQSIDMQMKVEKALLGMPEVKEVFARTGTAEVATDAMPPNISDAYVMIRPRSEWPDRSKSKAELLREIDEVLAALPGSNYEVSQPIELRFNELISGVRSDIGIKIFGDDMEALLDSANEVAAVMRGIEGASGVQVEQVSGLPVLSIGVKRDAAARFGLSIAEIQQVVQAAMGGARAGTFYEGDWRTPIIVRLPESLRQDVERLQELPIQLPPEHQPDQEFTPATYSPFGEGMPRIVPLREVADITLAPGPNQISRENGKRRITVTANIRQRDLGSFVEEAQAAVESEVKLPPGYWFEWGGQFEQLVSATQRLSIVVPAALVLIFALLFASLGTAKDALLVFSGVPLALTGGLAALALRGLPLSISAGVGFIALSGVAVLNGLVIISFINNLRAQGLRLDEAIWKGAITRLRPVLMTALVASLGFVPMALATSAGAEVQRPLATVVIGGILSSTILTLIVLPVIYRLAHAKEEIPAA